MDLTQKIEAFSRLGNVLSRLGVLQDFSLLEKEGLDAVRFKQAFDRTVETNAWFTPESVFRSLYCLGTGIDKPELALWMKDYNTNIVKEQKTVAVIMAGNIPAVGFHDFLSVIMSGHRLLAKLSTDDRYLIPAIAGLLESIDPEFGGLFTFTDDTIRDFDAVIATGSNNTSRYFNHYFGRYPHIIRRNRNAIAVLNGYETEEEMHGLGDDIFMYYGLGCRNVSKIFIPEGFDFNAFFRDIEAFSPVGDHHKYRNNYDYNKSIYLVNSEPHFDNGFLLLKEGHGIATPVSVLHYEYYKDLDQVSRFIEAEQENIQCVVSAIEGFNGAIAPGTSQYPKLWDYADGVDTMEFLLNL